MKNTILIFSLLMLTASFNVFAARGELKTTMQEIGAQFKILHEGLVRGAPKTDQELKDAAGAMAIQITAAATKAPKQLIDANGNTLAGKEADVAVYDELIAKLDVENKALQEALKNGDRALAAQTLRDRIMPLMKDGHERFK